MAFGQLSLSEHRAWLDRLYAAVTLDEVAALTVGLPPPPPDDHALIRSLGPYRCVLAGGRVRRTDAFRVGRFCILLVAAATLDLDLRTAQLSQGEVTFTVYALRAHLTLTVPPRARVANNLRTLGGRRASDDDGQPGPPGSAEAPIIRIRGAALASTFQVLQG